MNAINWNAAFVICMAFVIGFLFGFCQQNLETKAQIRQLKIDGIEYVGDLIKCEKQLEGK